MHAVYYESYAHLSFDCIQRKNTDRFQKNDW